MALQAASSARRLSTNSSQLNLTPEELAKGCALARDMCVCLVLTCSQRKKSTRALRCTLDCRWCVYVLGSRLRA